jgi:superfamily II DNA or RNA helicase
MKKCKLVIKDEVNVKFENLDLDMRKLLSKKFKYQIPYARHLPAVRLGRWDGCVAFFQLGGSTYLNLLTEIIPILDSKGWDIELEDLRQAKPNFNFAIVTEDSFSHITWPKGHPQAGQPIVLRDYQVEVINGFLNNPGCLQEVATGAGKTIMTAALSSRVEPYGRSIVIVPNKSLVTQTEADYINMGLDVGVFFGDRKEWNKTHTICTWQSLNSLFKKSRDGDIEDLATFGIEKFIEGVVAIIVDEVHMAKADALKTLLTGVMANIPLRWGLTGTVPKEDFEFMSIKCSLGDVVNRLAASELQDKGVLAQCHVRILQTQETQDYKNYQSEVAYLVTDPKRLDWIADQIKLMRKTGNTLILVDRINCGQELISRIDDAVFVSGNTKASQRKEEYDEVAEASDKVIVATYGVAAVGINIPRIFNLVLVEPGKSFVRVIQSIGRGIRKAEDKDFVQIWDVTSNCKFSKRHLAKRKTFYNEANYPYTIQKVNI